MWVQCTEPSVLHLHENLVTFKRVTLHRNRGDSTDEAGVLNGLEQLGNLLCAHGATAMANATFWNVKGVGQSVFRYFVSGCELCNCVAFKSVGNDGFVDCAESRVIPVGGDWVMLRNVAWVSFAKCSTDLWGEVRCSGCIYCCGIR